MYSSSQHATEPRALAHRPGDSTSSASVSSSSSSSNQTPPPYLTHPPRHSSRATERGPKPTLNHSRSESSSPVYQDSRYPMFRQSSPQYLDVSPTSPPRETLMFHGQATHRPGGKASSTPPPTRHRVAVSAYSERPATRMDRRRESLMKNASLRVHPFIAMGNSSRSAQSQEVLEDSASRAAPEPVGYRWATGPSGSNGAPQSSAAPPAAQAAAGVASTGHSRSISFAQSNATPAPATSVPPARAHQRTVSENPASTAPMAAPQRRGLGLVRKISFRSRADRATLIPARSAPVRASSDDSELLIKTSEDNDDSRPAARVSPVPTSNVQQSAASASPARHATSASAAPVLSRSASTSQTNTPVRPTRSPRRSPAQATVEPSTTPAQAGASQPPSTPPPPPPRPLAPRSPTASGRRSSGSGSPRRQSLSAARRAEREWKAKLAALAAAAPSTTARPSNGPRPPPRRVPLPSAAPLGIEARMAQSLSLSHLAASIDAPEQQRVSYPSTDRPDFTVAPPNVAPSLPRSASTSHIPRPPRRSPPTFAAPLPNVPEHEPTLLSTIEQEPVSQEPAVPLTPVAGEMKNSSQVSASSRKSLAPSQRTFGGHQASSSMSSRDWMPDERVVVTRSSVPDLGRVASPPPLPTTPASPALRLAEKTPPAPAPACTPPSPPRTFSHLPPPPTPPQILAGRGTTSDKLQAAMFEGDVNRQPRIHMRSKSKPNLRDMGMVNYSPPPELPTAPLPPTPLKPSRSVIPARATAAAPSILPRTTSLMARDIVYDTATAGSTPRRLATSSSRPKTNVDVTVVEEPLPSDDAPKSSAASHKLRDVYDLTPGLDTGRRPRKRGLPMDDLQRWLAQTAVV